MSYEWRGTSNYTKGNQGRKWIFPHICEGWYEGSIATLQNPSRQASAHYVVEGSKVAQLVKEANTAWHCGNWYYNCRSLSIEMAGTTANPPTRETLNTAAELMADMSRYWFGGAKLVLGKDGNVMLHKWVSSTSCPSTADIDYLLEKANSLLGYNQEEPKEEPDMTDEQAKMLEEVYNMLTRKDNAGWTYSPEGHNMFGRANMITNQLKRTDNAGHDNPEGHDIFGRINIIEHNISCIMDKLGMIDEYRERDNMSDPSYKTKED